ncbi:MAG: MgtC/SapB family protein [Lachnospiraceae bacterium]
MFILLEEINQYLQDFNTVSITLRLVLATVFGSFIGAERATKRQTAGIRTFAIVCLGAALSMIVNEYISIRSGNVVDPSRMAAQVVSGIGFLGVGTIIVTERSNGKSQVKGLTTAASLWTVAILGIAVGAGFLYAAVIAFLLIMLVVTILDKASKHEDLYNPVMEIYMEAEAKDGIHNILNFITENEFQIRSMQRIKRKTLMDEDVAITVAIHTGGRHPHQEILEEFQKIEGLHYLEEL